MSARKEIHRHEQVPPYYGLAWFDYNRGVDICYPIPLNFVIGWIYLFRIALKRGPAWLTYKIQKRFDETKPQEPGGE